jgi:hypothetical protein
MLNAAALCLVVSWPAMSQESAGPEHITATLAFVGGPAGGKTIDLNFRIKRYASMETIAQYGEILKEEKQEGLRRALEKEDNGQISPTGSVGIPIAVATIIPKGDSRTIHVTAVRYMPFLELWYGGRSRDYPFAIFRLTIGPDGKGSGDAILAAKIRFRKQEQTYEIESFDQGARNTKLLNVRVAE